MIKPRTRVGHYVIREPLGSGGMGDVYRASDLRLDRDVAIKLLRDQVQDEASVRRFEREARSLARLNHPNIVALFDVGRFRGHSYLVTELLEGATLRERLREGPPLNPWELGRQLAAGIAAAHRRGIVHRDLKPENLVLTSEGALKILDLGVAKLASQDDTVTGAIIGTSGYMAPEQLRGQPATFRSDVFSFGAILFELCTGRRAFEGTSAIERAYATLTTEPDLECTGALAVILSRCLQKDPAQRFASGEELVAAFDTTAGARGAGLTLPSQSTTAVTGQLIGRDSELAALMALLDSPGTRLVTITGSGGCGKTRLAQHLLQERARTGERSVFVPLAPLRDPTLVMSAIAKAFNIPDASYEDRIEVIAGSLRHEPLVLVLDNFEHVLPAARDVVELLARTERLRIIVTSRVLLRVRGETAWRLEPLAAPEPDEPFERVAERDAVKLFRARALAVDPSFVLDASNVADVAEICRRLEGLPLALELAAAHLKVLTPTEVRARLAGEPALSLLVGGPVDVPRHQQALRSTFEWSYELLRPEQRQTFRALSVFAGGFTVDAASVVAMPGLGTVAALERLEALSDQSLLKHRDSKGRRRLSLLEPLREFAQERLIAEGELEAVLDRHAKWVLAFAESLSPLLQSPRQLEAEQLLEDEHANVRVALDRARSRGDGPFLVRLATAVAPFWQIRAYLHEGHAWLSTGLSLLGDDAPDERARALTALGELNWSLCRLAEEQRCQNEAIALFRTLDDRAGLGLALARLARATMDRGDFVTPVGQLEEAMSLLRSAGQRRSLADALYVRAALSLYREDFAEMERYLDEALELLTTIGDPATVALARNLQGEGLRAQGRFELAGSSYEEALRLARETGNRRLFASASGNLALVLLRAGESERSAALSRDGIRVFLDIGNRTYAAFGFLALAGLALDRGDPERALTLVEACRHQLASQEGTAMLGSDQRDFAWLWERCAAAIHDPERFARTVRAADRLSFEQALQLALQPST